MAHSDRQPLGAGRVRQPPLPQLADVGDPANTQERLVAIDAETGKVVWEQRFSLYLSDVPQHRAVVGVAGGRSGNRQHLRVHRRPRSLSASSPDGKVLWDRSLPDEYGAVTTHGGRTTSPIIEGDKVILNALILAWGDLEPHRQPLLRVRQEDRPDGLDQLAAGAALRHQLLDADRRRPSTARAR